MKIYRGADRETDPFSFIVDDIFDVKTVGEPMMMCKNVVLLYKGWIMLFLPRFM